MARQYINYNGKIYHSGKLIISPDNRSFRYGDGFFETMKMINGRIILQPFHFERLFSSLETLRFEKPSYFTEAYLKQQVEELVAKNNHAGLARIRLMIFRGDGGLYDAENHFPNLLVQTWQMDNANNRLNENGLVTDIFPHARKACDLYSPVKSNNYLPYAMAALWAKENRLNDALLLNSFNRVADATIANIFVVKDGAVLTPSLQEGCVSGVMRRYLLQCLRKENIPVQETQLSAEDVYNASEVFLTNAGYNLRWVKQVGRYGYQNQLAAFLHNKFVVALLNG
ncbi:aminotransferase class IV [Foetidibacter luteolus]|uniref:aminotransferase class IV n=1 Tax=Foetidibacter luteolus TaxID=2608880 RepID=UPI00129ACB7E|nr:aminotransferase class IV [Foetidibacter luteolus]